MSDSESIHAKLVVAVSQFKKTSTEILNLMIQAEAHRVHELFGLTSTFDYLTKVHKLTEAEALMFIRVGRKCVEVPALKAAIERKEVTVATAKKFAAALTTENQEVWIERAKTLPTAELERLVVLENPKAARPDRLKPLAPELFDMQCAVDQQTRDLLKEAQDLVSQQTSAPADLNATLKKTLLEFVQKHSPTRKAQRLASPTVPGTVVAMRDGKRTTRPAAINHAVHSRDEGQCTFHHPVYGRCQNRRWIQFHHVRAVNEGGQHSPSNLTTLCSPHHRKEHKTHINSGS